jgi:hypothetical protein
MTREEFYKKIIEEQKQYNGKDNCIVSLYKILKHFEDVKRVNTIVKYIETKTLLNVKTWNGNGKTEFIKMENESITLERKKKADVAIVMFIHNKIGYHIGLLEGDNLIHNIGNGIVVQNLKDYLKLTKPKTITMYINLFNFSSILSKKYKE